MIDFIGLYKKYTPDAPAFGACVYLRDEGGLDWYDVVKNLHTESGICFVQVGAEGGVTDVQPCPSMLSPDGMSVYRTDQNVKAGMVLDGQNFIPRQISIEVLRSGGMKRLFSMIVETETRILGRVPKSRRIEMAAALEACADEAAIDEFFVGAKAMLDALTVEDGE